MPIPPPTPMEWESETGGMTDGMTDGERDEKPRETGLHQTHSKKKEKREEYLPSTPHKLRLPDLRHCKRRPYMRQMDLALRYGVVARQDIPSAALRLAMGMWVGVDYRRCQHRSSWLLLLLSLLPLSLPLLLPSMSRSFVIVTVTVTAVV